MFSQRNQELKGKELFCGLWPFIASFNHSCLPNCFYYGIGPYLIVKSIKDIKPNEELTISYLGPQPFDSRSKVLYEKWDFKCDCSLCHYERKFTEKKKSDSDLAGIEYTIYQFICNKIQRIKQEFEANQIHSYLALPVYFQTERGKQFLQEVIEWLDEISRLNSKGTLLTSSIGGQAQSKSPFRIELEKLMTKKLVNCETEMSKSLDELWYSQFLFYKFVSEVLSYSELNEHKAFCFEKAYSLVNDHSCREAFEMLVNYEHFCQNNMLKLRVIELKLKIQSLYEILFKIN